MPYTVSQIKVAAYNRAEQKDYTPEEHNLFLGLQYCYDWFKQFPDDQADCMQLMDIYIEWFNKCSVREIAQKGGDKVDR